MYIDHHLSELWKKTKRGPFLWNTLYFAHWWNVQKDDVEALAGYLSLHQNAAGGMSLKWTPNQLMNGGADDDQDASVDRRSVSCCLPALKKPLVVI